RAFEHKKNGMGGDYKDLVKKKEIEVSDFAPIIWVSETHKKTRVIMRFIPSLRDDERPKALTDLPMSGNETLITDNEGTLWVQHFTFEGKYVGLVASK